jgi:hypothetical protein
MEEGALGDLALPDQKRVPELEQQWVALSPALEAGIRQVEAVLQPLQVSIGDPGNARWSFKNRGFGAHRRILLNGDSVAWLRLEVAHDLQLHARIRAHKDEMAIINGESAVPAENLAAARAGDLLSQCLKPLAAYVANAGDLPERRAGEKAWREVDTIVAAALQATNGALAQAGAKIVPLGPAAWEAETRRYRAVLSIDVNGTDVARMHIERLPHELEVAVGVRDARMLDLGRRRRIPMQGMTIHALAELMAGCAWPAIARFRESRRSA